MDGIAGLIQTAFLAGGVLALAALGKVLCERAGVVNLGVEGMMALSAVSAIAMVVAMPVPGLRAALAVDLVFVMLFAVATVVIRANQVLCGLALTLIGTRLAATVGKAYSGTATFRPLDILHLSELPFFGRALFSNDATVQVIFVVLPLALHWRMFLTQHGLNMRAVGENPAAADAAGIPVMRIRFWNVAVGSMLAAGSGAWLTLAFVPSWSDGVVAGRGWIAVALVIYAGFRPIPAVLAALLSGFVTGLGLVGQARNWPIATPSRRCCLIRARSRC